MSLDQQVEQWRIVKPRYCCYKGGYSTPTLKVYLVNGDFCILPWGRFIRTDGDGKKLLLTFAERIVEVYGCNLAKLADDIGSFHLEILREVPSDYRALTPVDDVFVSKIELRPA